VIEIGSSGSGSWSTAMLKNRAMCRRHRYPERTMNSGSGRRGASTVEASREAPSRMAPAAVIQDLSGWVDRKKTRAGKVLWLSSTSVNQSSHSAQSERRFSSWPTVHARAIR
jgi:hypothetical protein